MKAVVLSRFKPQDALEKLIEDFPEVSFVVSEKADEIKESLKDAEIFITIRCTPENINISPKLKWIQALSAGVDTYPLEKIKNRGIILTNVRGIHSVNIAEYVICAMIMQARSLPNYMKDQQMKKWDRTYPQGEIYGATIGILGLGAIGVEIARKASFMGMKVIGVKRSPGKVPGVDKVYGQEEMEEVFRESDYVVNLLPYTPGTEKIISKKYFDLMKNSASFINVGRGKTVNEKDLAEVLAQGKIKGLVGDVFYEEPLPEVSPLWELNNVFITPHIAGSSEKYLERAAEIIRHNLRVYLNNEGAMLNLIDLDAGY